MTSLNSQLIKIATVLFMFPIYSQAVEVYFTPSDKCESKIVEQISDAKKEVQVAVYSINNDKIVGALKAAHKRGLKIRVLTDSLQAAGASSKAVELLDAGLDLKVHSVNKIMHNKFAVFDGKAAVSGSYNWTNAASNQNSENCVFFSEANILEAYQTQFENLWTVNTKAKSVTKIARIKARHDERTPANK